MTKGVLRLIGPESHLYNTRLSLDQVISTSSHQLRVGPDATQKQPKSLGAETSAFGESKRFYLLYSETELFSLWEDLSQRLRVSRRLVIRENGDM